MKAGTIIIATNPQEKPRLYRFMPFCTRWACSATGGVTKPMSSPAATPSQGWNRTARKLTTGDSAVVRSATFTWRDSPSPCARAYRAVPPRMGQMLAMFLPNRAKMVTMVAPLGVSSSSQRMAALMSVTIPALTKAAPIPATAM